MAALALPALREDIALLPGAPLADGQPSWVLHDPARNRFFQLDWASFELLRRWHLGEPARILAEVQADTTLQPELQDLEDVLGFLSQHQLLQVRPGSARQLADAKARLEGSLWQWLLHNYLFFRIPLLRPDRWLQRHLPLATPFFSPAFLWLSLLAGALGLIEIFRSWTSFSTTLVDLISWQGALTYGLTLSVVKLLHELGHGFTAKRYGCRVPSMGLAFLVLWPVAYTDTNEVWKLTRRDQRLKVAAAGILTELAVAAWAGFLWGWLPEGPARTAAFLLCTTTWVSSVFINASPFMRFDGYFLLADYLQLPNLHERAFALARWDLRRRLFGLPDPVPEHFPPGRHAFLIAFAWVTWLYRLTVFIGIAALVYHFFIKAVGILLFVVEMVWFILRPFLSEFRVWLARRREITAQAHGRRGLLLLSVLVLLFCLPWPARITAPGQLEAEEQWAIYTPEAARLISPPPANGSAIKAGAVAFQLASPALAARRSQNAARREQLTQQAGAAGLGNTLKRDWQVLNEQLLTAQAEQESLGAEASRFAPAAPFAGVLSDVPPDLRAGDWLARGELLGRVVRSGSGRVTAYVTEEDVHRLQRGDRALFVADGLQGPDIALEVFSVEPDASRTLPEAMLASTAGGHIAVRDYRGTLYPEHAIYRVQLRPLAALPPAAAQHTWRGEIVLAGSWEIPLLRFARSALSVLWRESGF